MLTAKTTTLVIYPLNVWSRGRDSWIVMVTVPKIFQVLLLTQYFLFPHKSLHRWDRSPTTIYCRRSTRAHQGWVLWVGQSSTSLDRHNWTSTVLANWPSQCSNFCIKCKTKCKVIYKFQAHYFSETSSLIRKNVKNGNCGSFSFVQL